MSLLEKFYNHLIEEGIVTDDATLESVLVLLRAFGDTMKEGAA